MAGGVWPWAASVSAEPRLSRLLLEAGVSCTIDLLGHEVRVRLNDRTAAARGDSNASSEMTVVSLPAEVQGLIERAVRLGMPDHPAYLTWLRMRENAPVEVPDECLGEALSACLLDSIRSRSIHNNPATGSYQAGLQESAQKQMLPADWDHFVRLVREEVTNMRKRADADAGGPRPLQRVDVGMAIRCALIERADEVRCRVGASEQRDVSQRFALFTFTNASRRWDSYGASQTSEPNPLKASRRRAEFSELTLQWADALCVPEPQVQKWVATQVRASEVAAEPMEVVKISAFVDRPRPN